METSATSAEEDRGKDENGSRSILSTLLERNDSVESTTDDLVERAATVGQAAFRAEFESKVSSLREFNIVRSKG